MDRVEILAAGRADLAMGRKAALRACIWFGFGYHLALEESDKAATEFLADIRAIVMADGGVKSEASARASTAKRIGSKFRALFGAELASVWESDAHRVQAMFNAAQESGATTVQKLNDWAEYGEPDRAQRIEAEKEAERAAKKADEVAAAEARLAGSAGASPVLGFDDVPSPIQTPAPATATATVQNLNRFDGMTTEDLMALVAEAQAEIERRMADAVAA